MDIIFNIKNTNKYNFQKLLDKVPFDDLHNYINIYDAS